jgi:hypothetical protein
MKAFYSIMVAVLMLVAAKPASSQGLPLVSQVDVTSTSTVQYNAETGLFTYSYTFTNYTGAMREVNQIHLPLRGAAVLNVMAPTGWLALTSHEGSMLQWCACAEGGIDVPPGYVDDGRGLPSRYQIKPGQSLSGFSFESPFPFSPGAVYAGGWVPILVEGVDFPDGQEPTSPPYPANMFLTAVAAAPMFSETLEYGGRRPSVDGFLVFTSIKDGGVYKAPLLLDVSFGQLGELVDVKTFKAILNGIDITSQFLAVDPKRRRTMLPIGLALKVGKNVLVTTVNGVVPGASRTAKDTDRLTFLIE